MPIDLSKLPTRLKEAARTGNLVPFIGSGVSRQAVTVTSKAFPTWSELLVDLAELAEEEGEVTSDEKQQIRELISRGKFLMAAQAVRSAMATDSFDHYIKSRFMPPDALPGRIHQCLFKLQPALVLTTNYDRLLEDAYASLFGKTADIATYKDAQEVQRFLQSKHQSADRPLIFKLHGTAASPSGAILAELDYRKLLYQEPGYRMVLSAIFLTRVVLMIGFSFSDPELTALVEALRESLKHGSSPDYIVLPKGEKKSVEKKRLREDFGLHLIEYEPSPDHSELTDLVEHLASLKAA